MSRLAASAVQTGKETMRETSDVQGAINGAEGGDARSRKDDNYGSGYPAQRNTAYHITYCLTEP